MAVLELSRLQVSCQLIINWFCITYRTKRFLYLVKALAMGGDDVCKTIEIRFRIFRQVESVFSLICEDWLGPSGKMRVCFNGRLHWVNRSENSYT